MSGDEVRLRSHSAIKLDAVRESLDAEKLLSAGQGIPSEWLGSLPRSTFVAVGSPKLNLVSQGHVERAIAAKTFLNQ